MRKLELISKLEVMAETCESLRESNTSKYSQARYYDGKADAYKVVIKMLEEKRK